MAEVENIKKQRGFTLIELLVVIGIILILTVLVLVALSNARSKTRDARRESDIRQIGLAMEMAYDDDQAYPTSATIPASIASSTTTYLESIPSDPKGGSYGWTDNTGDNQIYCVSADLENGPYFRCTQDGCSTNASACP